MLALTLAGHGEPLQPPRQSIDRFQRTSLKVTGLAMASPVTSKDRDLFIARNSRRKPFSGRLQQGNTTTGGLTSGLTCEVCGRLPHPRKLRLSPARADRRLPIELLLHALVIYFPPVLSR
jgi:hypothetical protein